MMPPPSRRRRRRRRPQQQQQQQQQPAVISDAAVEAAEQMARLLLQARQEVLFICCRVAFSCGCWEHYRQGLKFAGCGRDCCNLHCRRRMQTSSRRLPRRRAGSLGSRRDPLGLPMLQQLPWRQGHQGQQMQQNLQWQCSLALSVL